MAKSVGIDLGESAVKAVEIDGSYKKVRLTKLCHTAYPADGGAGTARAEAVAAAAKAALHDVRISGADSRLGHPCREAVLRTLDLPFSGADAVRKVVKSEVEGEIHSHSVDDMVVDFHTVSTSAEGTRVLVAAVPKAGLKAQLDALAGAGIEPEVVDLDTMALYRAAHWYGAFAAPAAGDGADAAQPADAAVATTAGGAAPRTAVLDLGARSTRVLLVEGEQLVDMRTLRLGSLALAEDLVRSHGVALDGADAAAWAALRSGSDQDVASTATAVATDDAAATGEGGAAQPAVATVRVRAADVRKAADDFLQRLRRELLRFVASAGEHGRVSMVWFTGGAARLEGVPEALREVFGCEARPLDLLDKVQHDLSPEEAAEAGPGIAVALGLALGAFGGPKGFNLRQEDLAYTRGFDRVKFPLAIFCMVALFAVLVWGVKLNNDLKNVEYELGRTYVGGGTAGKGTSFYGAMSAILPRDGSWFADARYVDRRDYNKLMADVNAAEVKDRIRIVRNWLRERVTAEQKKSGIFEDLNLESGLAVLVRFAEMLQSRETELGRYLLTRIELNMPATKGGRWLKFTVAFRGSDFRQRQGIVRQAILDECQRPDSPFEKYDDASRERRFMDGDKEGVEGAYFEMRILIKDQFMPFTGTPGPAKIGAADVRPGLDRGTLASAGQEEGR